MSDNAEDLFDEHSDENRHSERRRREYSDSEENEGVETDSDDNIGHSGRGRAGIKARRKRPKTSNFLDIEASVETDSEEDSDSDGALGDFIVDNEAELASAEKDALRHRGSGRAAFDADDTLDADAISAQLRERYSGYATGRTAEIDAEWVPQRLLLPGINDPHLWMARCIPGKERDAVFAAARRIFSWQSAAKTRGTLSVFARSGLSGYVYVEARTQADAQAALQGIAGVQAWRLTLVPIDDMVDVVRVKAHAPRIAPGAWVRVRRGNYAGDLAQVVAVLDSADACEVRLLPRLDYDGESRGRTSVRPPPRLFSVEEAQRADPRTLSSRQHEILWRGDRFVGGYLHKDMRIASLQTENVGPTLDEIARFAAGEAGDGDEQAAIAALASQAAAAGMADGVEEASGLTAGDLQPGEQVEVVEGDLAGVIGVVRSVEGDSVIRVVPDLGGARAGAMSFPARQLRKRFRTGDHVKVLNGRHRSETGMVVSIADAVVTVYADVAKREIRVLAKDLRVSSDVGAGAGPARAIVGLDLHDLVHLEGNTMGVVLKVDSDTLTVLDERNEVRSLRPQDVRVARGRFARTGVDFNGAPIKTGDVVRESAGMRRSGTVLQIARFVTFVLARDQLANGGVFAARTRQLEAANARHAALDPYATRSARGRGAPRARGRGGRLGSLRGGRDPLVGRSVVANRGPYKGYMGIVKDATDVMARVELHTNARVVNIEKEKLTVSLPTGERIPALEYNARSAPPSRPTSRTPSALGDANSMSAADDGWGAPPQTRRPHADPTPVATPGGWGQTPDPVASGWDADSNSVHPLVNAGADSNSGWDAPASGWDTPAAGSNWGTPAPITPGAIPQTPGGPFPQTPSVATPAVRDYYESAARPDDGFFSWAVPHAVVVLAGSANQRGSIADVSPDRSVVSVKLESGAIVRIDASTVARHDPRPVRGEKRDRVILIRGDNRGAVGTMMGKDGNEGFFKPDSEDNWHFETLRNIALYKE